MSGTVDVDSRIDYRALYGQLLQKVRPYDGGKHAMAVCPFHDDKGPSLSVSLEDGRYVCKACDAKGNVYTLVAHVERLSKEDAAKRVRALAGVTDDKPAARTRKKLTVADYCREKALPEEFIRSLGVKDARSGISIPYLDDAGEVKATKQRYAQGAGPRFSWTKGSSIIPYGLFHLEAIRRAKVVYLVEGESDAQTLWHHGITNALGIPGSQMMKQEWAPHFKGVEVVIHREPGEGGETFVKKICDVLARGQHDAPVKVFSMRGAKDPSDAHVAAPDKFLEQWEASLQDAAEVDVTRVAVDAQGILPGAPVNLQIPDGWIVTQKGIQKVNPKDNTLLAVCPVPILISRRLRSIDTGAEKIEIAYQRDGTWHSITTMRSTAFATRAIIELADRGLPITSEKARHIVAYLGDLEAANLEALPLSRSVERMGWVGASKFIPGRAGDVVLDVPDGSEATAEAYHAHGDLDGWIEAARAVADRWPLARFMLAAAFAAPMLKELRQRVFLVHFWGPSRAGKTAALKLALSAWGDPEGLMATFNTTKVGMERLAGFYNDLPLGVDERQIIGKDQNLAEGLVYLLGAGKGKVRGNKGGGLQATQTWRTIALTTGEEPLSRSASQTGVKSRALEIYGTPIGDEAAASDLHRSIDQHFGLAGPRFVDLLIEQRERGVDLRERFGVMEEAIREIAPSNMRSHVAATASICLADEMLQEWIVGKYSTTSLELGGVILGDVETEEESDYATRGEEWLNSWISINRARFVDDHHREPWGFLEAGVVWIAPSALERAMEDDGFSPRRVLRDLADHGRVVCDESSGPRRRLKVRKTWQGVRQWMVGYEPKRDPFAPSDPVEDHPTIGADQRWDVAYQ